MDHTQGRPQAQEKLVNTKWTLCLSCASFYAVVFFVLFFCFDCKFSGIWREIKNHEVGWVGRWGELGEVEGGKRI